MLALRLWNYLRGYVIIVVKGRFIEKFINICARRQIFLWDVRSQDGRLAVMKMSIRGFRLIRPVARKSRCAVRLLGKVGLPFLLYRYRKRKAFVAGAVLFIVLLQVISSFIWSVEITGNKKLDAEMLEEALARYGIRTGMLKYRINAEKAVNGMMLDIEDISWISISIRGTKARVELRERLEAPVVVPRNIPCDVVAAKDGIIKRIVAMEGVEAVAEGETVREGQVLISGTVPLKQDEGISRLVHAMGTVMARTWYEEEVPVITTVIERLKTGRVIKNHSLVLFSWKMDLPGKKNSFRNYSVAETRKKLAIGDLAFPLEWVAVTYFEEQPAEAVISEESAKSVAAGNALKRAVARVPEGAEIVKRNINFVKGDNGPVARATLECVEDIGVPRRIGGN